LVAVKPCEEKQLLSDSDREDSPLEGNIVRLRQILPRDYEVLYQIATSPSAGYRWRLRALTPAPEEFPQMFWKNVLVQFAITDHVSNIPRGVVTAYSSNNRDGWVYIAVVVDDPSSGTGRGLEASAMMISHLFTNWSFRKVYAEVPDFNLPVLGRTLTRFMQLEGTCREHMYYGAKYWDVHTFSVTRTEWRNLCETDHILINLFGNNHVANVEDRTGALLDLSSFLEFLVEQLQLAETPLPESAICADAGLDSFAMLELADLLYEVSGGVGNGSFDWLDQASRWSFRDLYLHYCTMCQMPSSLHGSL